MSIANINIGPDARLAVNTIMLGVVRHSVSAAGEEFDPSDSESLQSGWRDAGTGVNQARCSFTCKRASDVSPHVAPLNLTPRRGQSVEVQIWPDGIAGPVYLLTNCKVLKFTSQGDNSRSEPQTIDFDFVHSGEPVLYGGTN